MTGSDGRIDTAWPNKTWETGGTIRMRRARTAMITTMMKPTNVSGFARITRKKPFAVAVKILRRRVHAPSSCATDAPLPKRFSVTQRHSTRGSRNPYMMSATRFATTTPAAKTITTAMVPAKL